MPYKERDFADNRPTCPNSPIWRQPGGSSAGIRFMIMGLVGVPHHQSHDHQREEDQPRGLRVSGKLTSMSRPPSGRACAVSVASWALAMAWTMARPSPCPLAWRIRSLPSCWNGWNRRGTARRRRRPRPRPRCCAAAQRQCGHRRYRRNRPAVHPRGRSPVLPAGAADWLLRLTPAAAFAIQQTVPRYPQVSNTYVPFFGYYPLAPCARPAVAPAARRLSDKSRQGFPG